MCVPKKKNKGRILKVSLTSNSNKDPSPYGVNICIFRIFSNSTSPTECIFIPIYEELELNKVFLWKISKFNIFFSFLEKKLFLKFFITITRTLSTTREMIFFFVSFLDPF